MNINTAMALNLDKYLPSKRQKPNEGKYMKRSATMSISAKSNLQKKKIVPIQNKHAKINKRFLRHRNNEQIKTTKMTSDFKVDKI